MIDIEARLEALAAGPKPWAYVVRYDDGHERRIPCIAETAARHGAERESRNIGRPLIDRSTGATVRVVSVTVEREAV